MSSQLERDEVLQALGTLIQRSEQALEEAEDELHQVRANLVALTIKEHIAGPLSAEEDERKKAATARFRILQGDVNSERDRLRKLRLALDQWAGGLPESLQNRFEELLTST